MLDCLNHECIDNFERLILLHYDEPSSKGRKNRKIRMGNGNSRSTCHPDGERSKRRLVNDCSDSVHAHSLILLSKLNDCKTPTLYEI
jgi:hypothetical protein